jgi:hypothetical protein
MKDQTEQAGAPASVDGIEIIDDPDSGEPVVLWGAPGAAADDRLRSLAEPPRGFGARIRSLQRASTRAGDAVGSAAFRWNRRFADMAPVGDVRSHSRVRLHAWADLPTLLDRLGDGPLTVSDESARVLFAGDTPLTHWTRGIHRTPGRLIVRWAWPTIPVWVVAEPWWREHTVLTMSLRTNHRWRYPRRYWSTAHRALRQIALAGRPTEPVRPLRP